MTDDPASARPLRILVVDDHEIVRQGLVALLDRREGFEVVAQAGTVAEAVAEARRFAPDLVDYEQGWQTQREVHAQVVDGILPDTTLLLEHAAVYTAGKRTEPHERPTDGTPVIDVDRGGKITWHGPGQLVGYPIVRLHGVPIDVVAHVRRLEEVMIRTCREFGVETVRVDGRSGVWVLADDRGPDRKLGAIGVRVTDSNGVLQGAATIAKDYGKYGSVVLSREKVDTSPSKPTTIVARAPLAAPTGGG